MADHLLFGASSDERVQALYSWFHSFDHGVLRADYHRMQIEHWLWTYLRKKSDLRVIDIGQHDAPRVWLEIPAYYTLGYLGDIVADLRDLPIDGVDAIICTEVLEHCAHPRQGCNEMYRALAPGGEAFIATPFCWPDHRTEHYDDYWRFTEQGLELMLGDAGFEEIEVKEIQFTHEGQELYDLMRRFECFGLRGDVMMHTGYMVRARKGAA